MARVMRSFRFALVAVVLVLALPTSGNSQQENAAQQEAEAQKSPAPSAVLTIAAAPGQPTPCAQSAAPASDPQSWNDWFWQNSTALLLAVIGIWATCIALNTLDAIRDQAKIAREALTRLERALVVVGLKEATIHWITDESFLVRIILSKRNVGRSPAWVLGGVTKLVKLAGPLAKTPDYRDDRTYSPEPIAPGDKIEMPEERIGIDTDAEAAAVMKGELRLRIYGILHYRDVFGSYETRFSLCLYPPVGTGFPQPGRPVNVEAFFDGPEAYNRYTEDQEKQTQSGMHLTRLISPFRRHKPPD